MGWAIENLQGAREREARKHINNQRAQDQKHNSRSYAKSSFEHCLPLTDYLHLGDEVPITRRLHEVAPNSPTLPSWEVHICNKDVPRLDVVRDLAEEKVRHTDRPAHEEAQAEDCAVQALRAARAKLREAAQEDDRAQGHGALALAERVKAVFRVSGGLEDVLELALSLVQLFNFVPVTVLQARPVQDLLHGRGPLTLVAMPWYGFLASEHVLQVIRHLLEKLFQVHAAVSRICLPNKHDVLPELHSPPKLLRAPSRSEDAIGDEKEERPTASNAVEQSLLQAGPHIDIDIHKDANAGTRLSKKHLHCNDGVLAVALQVGQEDVVPLRGVSPAGRHAGG
mmetsp:Transcript_129680/g.375594  ORF Transcript_129680/g.375594 Transcript_129680/m.375594 type:complete len:339 (-) Transcript_129680:308-1324(-)